MLTDDELGFYNQFRNGFSQRELASVSVASVGETGRSCWWCFVRLIWGDDTTNVLARYLSEAEEQWGSPWENEMSGNKV